MDPSSLIFVAIVAIWAAYLLGHWVRRRDQLATARSIDRFSSGLRVLERRPVVRAAAHPPCRTSVTARPVARTAPARPTRRPASRASQPPAAPPRAASARRRAARRRKGVLLLALLVGSPTLWVLALAGQVIPPWPAVVVTVGLVLMVVHLRRAARRAAGRAVRRARTVATAPRSRATRRPQPGDGLADASGRARASMPSPGREAAPSGRPRARMAEPAPTQIEPPEVGFAAPAAGTAEPEPVHTSGPGDPPRPPSEAPWVPVPVPPPTYTMKAKAPDVVPAAPEPESASPSAPSVDLGADPARAGAESLPSDQEAAAPSPVVSEDASRADTGSFDLDEILERRIAAGG